MATADWCTWEQTAPRAACSIVCIGWLASSPDFPRLRDFKSRHPHHPVVLVTRWDPENARCIKDLPVEEVVWFGEVNLNLEDAVRRACAREFNYVRCMAVPFEEAKQLPAALCTALAHACRSPHPVGTVNRLAAATGTDRRILAAQWRQVFGANPPLSLKGFLRWILLLRAVGRKTPSEKWSAVAAWIGVSHQTLWRMAQEFTESTLPQLVARGPADLATTFRTQVLDLLLADTGSDKL